jgi:hypothetical protein
MSDTGRLACHLDALPLAETARYHELRQALARSIRDARELPDGWALELDPSPEAFLGAAAWITLERLCCPFLEFDLGWSPARHRVQLRLTGPEAARGVAGKALGGWLAARRPVAASGG